MPHRKKEIAGLDISENFQIAQVSKSTIIDFALKTVGNEKPDALFVSCTNFPAMQVLNELRSLFSFPVITSNQIAFESTLQCMGYSKAS